MIPETTNVLTDATTQYLASISGDGSVFTFSQASVELDAVSPGEVIAGGVSASAPNGFLRKVTTVSSAGGQVTVETEEATLEDAIEAGGFEISRTLSPGDIQQSAQLEGVALVRSAQSQALEIFSYILDNVVLYDFDGNENTTDDQVTANGGITLELDYDFTVVIEKFHIEKVSFTTTATETADLQIDAHFKQPIIQEEVEIARHFFAPFTVTLPTFPPLPVVIVPVLTINIGVDGSIHVGASTGVTQQTTLTGGLRYYGGLEVPVGVKIEILGRSLTDYETTLIDYRLLLAQAEVISIAGGTWADRNDGLMGTGFLFAPNVAGEVISSLQIYGPAGWNGDSPLTCSLYQPVGIASDRSMCWDTIVPITGDYVAQAMVGGQLFVGSLFVDASSELGPAEITGLTTSSSEVKVDWTAPSQALSFLIRVNPTPWTGTITAESVLPSSMRTATLSGLSLDPGASYQVVVWGFSADIVTPGAFARPFNLGSDSTVFVAP